MTANASRDGADDNGAVGRSAVGGFLAQYLDAAPVPDDPVLRPVVEFRRLGKKDDYVAFPYSQLIWVNYYASYGIIVHFGSHTVHVLGRRLMRLYTSLRDQTQRQVHMNDELEESDGEPFVTSIFILAKSSKDPGFERLEESDLESKDA